MVEEMGNIVEEVGKKEGRKPFIMKVRVTKLNN